MADYSGTNRNDRLTGTRNADTFVYDANLNAGTSDVFDGGAGNDTLVLRLTKSQWFNAALQNDIAALLRQFDSRAGNTGLQFTAFDLNVRNFEALKIIVDGVELTAKDDAVTANNDRFELVQDSVVSGNVVTNDRVPDLIRKVEVVSGPAAGALSFNPDGTFTFRANNDFDWLAEGQTKKVTFVYRLTDADGDTDTATVTLVVTGTNEKPVIAGGVTTGRVDEIADRAPGENSARHVATGTFAFTDGDLIDRHSVSFTALEANSLGRFRVSVSEDRADGRSEDSGGPGGGTVTWRFSVRDRDIDFLAEGQTLTQRYMVTIADKHGGSTQQIVTVMIVGKADGAVANVVPTTDNVVASGNEDTRIALTLRGSDSDGSVAAFEISALPSNGTLFDANGALVTGARVAAAGNAATVWFEPAANFNGQVSFTYAAVDNAGAKDATPATATVTVASVNDAPVAQFTRLQVVEDDPVVSGQLVATDADNGAVLTYSTVSGLPGLTINPNGSYTFDPSDGTYQSIAQGQTFIYPATYRVTDQYGLSSTANLTVNLQGRNDAPVAQFTRLQVVEDDPVVSGQLVATDADNGAVLTYSVVSGLPGLTINPDGSYTFDPSDGTYQNTAQGQTFIYPATYRVTDQYGLSSTANLTVNLQGRNDAAVITGDVSRALIETDAVLTTGGQLQAADIDNIPNQFQPQTDIAGSGGYGLFSISANGAWSYATTSAHNEFVKDQVYTDTLTVRSIDGTPQLLTIGITGTNDTPTSLDVRLIVREDDPIVTGDLVAGDADAGAVLTYTAAIGIPGLTINPNGSYAFDPSSPAYQYLPQDRTEFFTAVYRVRDEHGARSDNTLEVRLTGRNDAPVAQNSILQVREDNPVATGQLVATDADDGAVLTFSVAGDGLPGLIINADGSYTFNPSDPFYQNIALGQTAIYNVAYKVTDEHGLSSTANLEVRVGGRNDVPTALGVRLIVREDDPVVTGDVVASDVDNGAVLNYALTGSSLPGLTLNPDGSYSFDPSNTAYQHIAFGQTAIYNTAYTVTDEYDSSTTRDLEVRVPGRNDTPVAQAASLTSQEDGAVVTGQLIATDVDDGAVLTFAVVGAGLPGLTIHTDGSYKFDPGDVAYQKLSQDEKAIFETQFLVTDEHGASSSAMFAATLNGVNDAPVADTDTASVAEAGDALDGSPIAGIPSVTGNVLDNDTDVDANDTREVQGVAAGSTGAPLSSGVGAPIEGTYGILMLLADGGYTYALDNGRTATNALKQDEAAHDVFTYTMRDAGGLTSTAMLVVAVTGTNDAPVFTVVKGFSGGPDYIVNGSFELPDVPGATGNYGSFTSIPGWTLVNPSPSHTGNAFELTQDFHRSVSTPYGGQWLDSEATPSDVGDGFQQLVTVPEAGTYLLTFSYGGGGGFNAFQNADGSAIRLLWNGIEVPEAGITYTAASNAGWVTVQIGVEALAGVNANALQVLVANTGIDASFGLALDNFQLQAFDPSARMSVTENAPANGRVIGDVDATDPEGDAIVFSLAAGSDSRFNIDSDTGVIGVVEGSTFNFETTIDADGNSANGRQIGLDVEMADPYGATRTERVYVDVIDVQELASISGTSSGAVVANGALVASGALTVTDEDIGDATFQVPTAAQLHRTFGDFSFDSLTGAWSYTLNNDLALTQALTRYQTVTESLTVRSLDNSAARNITVSVTGSNHAPVAANDSYNVTQNTTFNATYQVFPRDGQPITENDTDADGDPLSVTLVSGPQHGTLTLIEGIFGTFGGEFVYSPDAGYTGTDSFTYRAADDLTASNLATVSLNIRQVIRANFDTFDLDEDTSVSGSVTANDFNSSGGALTASLSSGPAHGQLVFNADGTFTYTPDANYFGYDAFYYRVSDGALVSNLTVAGFGIAAINDAPAAVDDAPAFALDVHVGNLLSDTNTDPYALNVLRNDTDVDIHWSGLRLASAAAGPEGSAGTPILIDQNNPYNNGSIAGTYGTLSINASGYYNYTVTNRPNGNVTESFTYTVRDPEGLTDTAQIDIAIIGNTAPVAEADEAEVTLASPTVTGNVLTNDNDPEADILTVTNLKFGEVAAAGLVVAGVYGTLTMFDNGQYSYAVDPENAEVQALAPNATLTEIFTYEASDSGGLTSLADLTITIAGADNLAPHANDDSYLIAIDPTGPVYLSASGNAFLNDSDPEGGALRFASFDDFEFTPFTIDYSVETAWWRVFAAAEGPIQFNVFTDAFGNLDPALAAALQAPGDSYTYTFSYTVADTAGETSAATASFIVRWSDLNDNEPPQAVSDRVVASLTVSDEVSGNVLANDFDPQGATLAAAPASLTGVYGSAVLFSDGSFTYTVNTAPGAVRSLDFGEKLYDTLTYTASDSSGASSSADLTIEIIGKNDAPTTLDDAATVILANNRNAAGNVFANDSDPEGNALSVVAFNSYFSGPGQVGDTLAGSYGALTLNADGSYSYTAYETYAGPAGSSPDIDVFAYAVADEFGLSSAESTAQIEIRLYNEQPNRAPVVQPFQPVLVTAETGDAESPALLSNATDPDLDQLSVLVDYNSLPAGVSFTPAAYSIDGFDHFYFYSYDPAYRYLAEGQTANVIVNYSITDGELITPASVTFSVTGVDNYPVVDSPKSIAAPAGYAPVALNLSAPFDPDGDAISIMVQEAPVSGAITIGPNGGLVEVGDMLSTFDVQNLFFTAGATAATEQFIFYTTADLPGGGAVSAPFIAKLQSLDPTGPNAVDASQQYYHVNDILIGGAGDDTFSGFSSGATITSGDGADRFVFSDFNNPSVMDFSSGTDQLQLSASALNFWIPGANVQAGDTIPILAVEDPYAPLNPGDLPAQGGFFLLDNAGAGEGDLLFSSVDGGLPQGFLSIAQLKGVTQLTNSDFWIV